MSRALRAPRSSRNVVENLENKVVTQDVSLEIITSEFSENKSYFKTRTATNRQERFPSELPSHLGKQNKAQYLPEKKVFKNCVPKSFPETKNLLLAYITRACMETLLAASAFAISTGFATVPFPTTSKTAPTLATGACVMKHFLPFRSMLVDVPCIGL